MFCRRRRRFRPTAVGRVINATISLLCLLLTVGNLSQSPVRGYTASAFQSSASIQRTWRRRGLAFPPNNTHRPPRRNLPTTSFGVTTTGRTRPVLTSRVRLQQAVASSDAAASAPAALSLEHLECTQPYGQQQEKRLLDDVSYVLKTGARVALVGRNGAGKSTLLKIIAQACGAAPSSSLPLRYAGTVIKPRTVRVAYVEQDPPNLVVSQDENTDTITVGDALLGVTTCEDSDDASSSLLQATVRRYRRALRNADTDPEAFSQACMDMDAMAGGWDVLTRAEEVATRLRVAHLQQEPLHMLSGGERKRVALAAALIQEPDVLLLDEPTNFLSLAGVQWLADLLKQEKKLTLLMVTHDRAFLDDVCNSILELDNGQVFEYSQRVGSGSNSVYADYLQGKQERQALQDAALQSAKARYRVELDWMRRQPQARQSKSKARIDAFYKLEKSTQPRPREASLDLVANGSQTSRMGGKILAMRNVNLAFSERVLLNDFSYDFVTGDRICISGANGVGKTTFVRVLLGLQQPDSGEIEVGDTIVLGHYDQLGITIEDPNQTVLQFVIEQVQTREDGSSTTIAPDEARRLLQRFEFPRARWNDRISLLSGGERRRLQMLSVFSRRPNFLVLDEPSVDCDLETLSALENYLQEFDGVLIVISHDRAFADKVTDHLFIFEGEGVVKDFLGSLSEYASTLVELENDSIPSSGAPKSAAVTDKKSAYKEDRAKRNEQRNTIRRARKEMDSLEKSIEKLRQRALTTQEEIDSKSEEGWSVLAEITEKLGAINEEIDEKELRWMELGELLEEAEVEV